MTSGVNRFSIVTEIGSAPVEEDVLVGKMPGLETACNTWYASNAYG